MSSWLKDIYNKFFRRGQGDITTTKYDHKKKARKKRCKIIRDSSFGHPLQDERNHINSTTKRGEREEEERHDLAASQYSEIPEPDLNSFHLENKQEGDENEVPGFANKEDDAVVGQVLHKEVAPCGTRRKVCRFMIVIPDWAKSHVAAVSVDSNQNPCDNRD